MPLVLSFYHAVYDVTKMYYFFLPNNIMLPHFLTLTMLWAFSADNKLIVFFFLFFLENSLWHFMQIEKKISLNVICWICQRAIWFYLRKLTDIRLSERALEYLRALQGMISLPLLAYGGSHKATPCHLGHHYIWTDQDASCTTGLELLQTPWPWKQCVTVSHSSRYERVTGKQFSYFLMKTYVVGTH